MIMQTRDGVQQSLWQDTVEAYTPTNKTSHFQFDVAIAGGGITGVSLARALQRSGLKCVLFEAQVLGYGSTGGTTAHLNTLLDIPYSVIAKNFGTEGARQVARATREAIERINDDVNKLSIQCGFEHLDGYQFARNNNQVKDLEENFNACADAGLNVHWTKQLPLHAPFLKAMRVESQAHFNPLPISVQLK